MDKGRDMPGRVRFERPPLIFALGQIVMSDVLKIADSVPDIQDILRRHGFPLHEQQNVNNIELSSGRQPSIQTLTMWVFKSADQRDAVTLTPQSFVIQTSRYQGFERFLETIESVAAAVKETTDVALCRRVGLRYVNLIGTHLEADSVLDSSLLGLRQELIGSGMNTVMKRLEQVDVTPVGGTLVMRVIETRDGSLLPADLGLGLIPVTLDIERPPQAGTPNVVLDLDHFSTAQSPLEVRTLTQRFNDLHATLEERFFSVLTKAAHKAWGAQELA